MTNNRSCLFLLAALALLSPHVHVAASADDRVKVELYYESQCPACRETVTRSFKEAFDAPSFLKMADVTFIPFGNARESVPSTLTSSTDPADHPYDCQHGPTECQYNLMETCAIDKIGCPHGQFDLIHCIETYDESRDVDQDYDAVLDACSTLTGIPPDVVAAIKQCYKGPEGEKLEKDMADRTGALDPPHTYVPWIVIDGKHDEDVQEKAMNSLLTYVCGVYKGADRSPACPRPMSYVSSRLRAAIGSDVATTEVCHRDAPAVDAL